MPQLEEHTHMYQLEEHTQASARGAHTGISSRSTHMHQLKEHTLHQLQEHTHTSTRGAHTCITSRSALPTHQHKDHDAKHCPFIGSLMGKASSLEQEGSSNLKDPPTPLVDKLTAVALAPMGAGNPPGHPASRSPAGARLAATLLSNWVRWLVFLKLCGAAEILSKTFSLVFYIAQNCFSGLQKTFR